MTLTGIASAGRDAHAEESLAQTPAEHWPFYAEDEIEAVAEVLRSGKVNQWTGREVFAFQDACTERFGGGHGIALANGSLALELALRAFGIGPGDEVIVTPRTFVASAFCVDAGRRDAGLRRCRSRQRQHHRRDDRARCSRERTRAIIPVHLAGWPADMPAIMALAATARHQGDRGLRAGARRRRSTAAASAASATPPPSPSARTRSSRPAARAASSASRTRPPGNGPGRSRTMARTGTKVNAPAGQSGHVPLAARQRRHQLAADRAAGGDRPRAARQARRLDRGPHPQRRDLDRGAGAACAGCACRCPGPGLRHAYYKLYFYLDAPEARPSGCARRSCGARRRRGCGSFPAPAREVYREEAFADLPRPDCPVARALERQQPDGRSPSDACGRTCSSAGPSGSRRSSREVLG